MDQELINLFEELLLQWKMSEETVINDRGTMDDYKFLEEEENAYRDRLKQILFKINEQITNA